MASCFKCSICLDDFTDPVSTPCGHNFCQICINTYWDSADNIQCPLCQHSFKKRPQLNVNVMLRDLIEQKQTNTENAPDERSQTQYILCDPCAGEEKRAVKTCLHCEESLCSEHVQLHKDDTELKNHELLNPVSRLKERVCKQHKKPLELVCHHDLTCVCVLCIKSNHQDHKCIPLKNRLRKKKAQVDHELSEVQQEIKDRKILLKKVEASREISEKNTKTDIIDTQRIFTRLQQVVKINESGLVAALALLHRKAENRSESLKENLEEEISELEERRDELKQLSQMGDDLRLLQSLHSLCDPPSTKDWSDISACSDSAVGTVRSAINKLLLELKSEVNNGMEGMITKEIQRIQQYAVDVTLDCDTANHVLIISNDGKQVRNGGFPQKLPENPKRFDPLLGVLGKEGYSSGAFYFEVQVEGKAGWDIGVAMETVDRKKQTEVCLSHGFAVLMLRDGKSIKACDLPPVEINFLLAPKKIGVFVDVEEGEVCFYDVGNKAHIYSFTRCRFPKKKLHPYFNPCTQIAGKNSAPMVITPVT